MPKTPKQRTAESSRRLLAWYPKNARDLPWRRTTDPYAIWVSEIMLQQTQVKTVIPYWERWMRELPTLERLAAASESKLYKLWEGLGYYTRVQNMQRAAREVVLRHKGRFPENFDEVLALPGIGRYTAGAICSIAFNQPQPILDGNVIRVLTRVFGITGDPHEKETNQTLWALADELVKHSVASQFRSARFGACSALNQSMMELGAIICTARSPKCEVCPLAAICVARLNGLIDQLPALRERAKVTNRRFIAFIVERRGRYLVRQRPPDVVNGNLWEFPNIEIESRAMSARAMRSQLSKYGFALTDLEPVLRINHSITRYRIRVEACRADLVRAERSTDGLWLNMGQLQSRAFTSAHRRIAVHLMEQCKK